MKIAVSRAIVIAGAQPLTPGADAKRNLRRAKATTAAFEQA